MNDNWHYSIAEIPTTIIIKTNTEQNVMFSVTRKYKCKNSENQYEPLKSTDYFIFCFKSLIICAICSFPLFSYPNGKLVCRLLTSVFHMDIFSDMLYQLLIFAFVNYTLNRKDHILLCMFLLLISVTEECY